MGKGRSYTVEFKQQAIDLAESLGSVTKAANQLGIPDVNIHCWRKKLGERCQNGIASATSTPELEEIKKLRKEVAELKHVNLILKTEADFFSQENLKKNTG